MGILGSKKATFALTVAVLCASVSRGTEILSEHAGTACETFVARRELRVFKDPTIFLPNVSLILADPKVGWRALMQESPLLNSYKGEVKLARLGKPRDFKNFGVIARLYELVEPRLRLTDADGVRNPSVKIVPVQVCGQGALGFVLEQDLQRAAVEEEGEEVGMPPSVYPNPVPAWRGATSPGAKR